MTTEERYEQAKKDLAMFEAWVKNGGSIELDWTSDRSCPPQGAYESLDWAVNNARESVVSNALNAMRDDVLALGDQVLAELRTKINELEAKGGGE